MGLALASAVAAPAGPQPGDAGGRPTPELCGDTSFAQPASTREMVALLAQITRDADPMRNPSRSSDQVLGLRAQIARTTAPARLFELQLALGRQVMQAGQPEAALREYELAEQLMQQANIPLDDRYLPELLTARALCHLRLGELENCLVNHNAESCLFPLRGGGIHTLTRGSRAAIEILNDLLARFPGDLRGRWLLNLAYMTLGEYPDQVPPKFLIPPKAFASDYDIQRFPDVAARLGIGVHGHAGGVVLEDLDNDGLLDLMVSGWCLRDQLRVFRNQGDGTFTERTAAAGLMGLEGGLNLIHADYNNDGFMDVLVLRGGWLYTEGHYPNSLLRNNGDFTFTDVTVEAGLLAFAPTQTATWFDYNGDGRLDLFVGNESVARDTSACELYRNNGDGTFTECAAAQGLDLVAFYKGVTSGDYNNDGRPDLLLSRKDGPPQLFRNDGPAEGPPAGRWRFTEVAEAAGITQPVSSFPCWFFDYDNDGWPDIMVSGYQIQDVGDVAADVLGRPHAGQRARLYRNNGDGTFSDVSRAMGVNKLLHTMGCNFGDLDNDGWLDFYVGTGDPDYTTLIPNRMFRNDGGRRFQDVTTSGGFGQLQKGHGIAFGDYDNDGDQDIYSKVGGAAEDDTYHSQLFANPGHGNHWLKLEVEGVKSNRAAIGVRVRVYLATPAGERVLHRTIGTGASFGSATLRQEIGLGDATAITRVELFWPVTGQTQTIAGLEVDRAYLIREGDAAASPLVLKSFGLPLAPPAAGAGHPHH